MQSFKKSDPLHSLRSVTYSQDGKYRRECPLRIEDGIAEAGARLLEISLFDCRHRQREGRIKIFGLVRQQFIVPRPQSSRISFRLGPRARGSGLPRERINGIRSNQDCTAHSRYFAETDTLANDIRTSRSFPFTSSTSLRPGSSSSQRGRFVLGSKDIPRTPVSPNTYTCSFRLPRSSQPMPSSEEYGGIPVLAQINSEQTCYTKSSGTESDVGTFDVPSPDPVWHRFGFFGSVPGGRSSEGVTTRNCPTHDAASYLCRQLSSITNDL